MITNEQIMEDVAQAVVKASSHWREDQVACWKCAAARETKESAKWAMENFLRNAQAADEHSSALCDDTGTPHPFLEIGDEAVIPPGFLGAMEEGIRLGMNRVPTRPMGVKGNDLQRIDQCLGMYDEPGMLLPAPTQIRRIPGSKIRFAILMLGGGPEIRSKTQPIFHMHSVDHVVDEMIQWAIPIVCVPRCLIADVLTKAEEKIDYEKKRVEAIQTYINCKAAGRELPDLTPGRVKEMLDQ